jgi:cytochrome c-type biogenesis protein CcmH/NrfG
MQPPFGNWRAFYFTGPSIRFATNGPIPSQKDDLMPNEPASGDSRGWTPMQIGLMSIVCLLVGLALGYLFRGSESQAARNSQNRQIATVSMNTSSGAPTEMPSLEDMKHMADKQAEPLLAKLQSDPANSQLLNQIGTLYKAAHQFKQAAEYYRKAVDADPGNVAARTDLASCLYYQGDADGAIGQLQQSLRVKPGDPNSLFNLGTIRLQAKHDSAGAIKAWEQLLSLNPELAEPKKAEVQKLIAQLRGNRKQSEQ